jgi:hypothetical protein
MGLRSSFPAAVLALSVAAAHAQAAPTFQQAADRGMVGMAASKSVGENSQLFMHLREIDPRIVNGFAFFCGGPTQAQLDSVAPIVTKIREQVPEALPSVAQTYPPFGWSCIHRNRPWEHLSRADGLIARRDRLKMSGRRL